MTAHTKTPDIDYDGSYRKLFGNAAMVRDLIRWGHIPAALTADIDPDTPMKPLNLHHPLPVGRSGGEKKKEGDLAFQTRNRPAAAARHTFVMLEFQSSKDAMMDVRIASYAALISLQADRTDANKPAWAGKPGDSPDPIIPVVIYNGSPRWTKPDRLRHRTLCGKRKALRAMQLDIDYHLIDIGALELPDRTRGPCDVLFALERCTVWENVLPLVKRLIHHLKGPETASLREAFVDFILVVLGGRGMPIPDQTIRDLQGLHTMLGQNIDKMRENDRQQGAQQGAQQAMQAAMRLGRLLSQNETAHLVAHLAAHPMTVEQIAQASPAEVEGWIAPSGGTKNGTNGRRKR